MKKFYLDHLFVIFAHDTVRNTRNLTLQNDCFDLDTRRICSVTNYDNITQKKNCAI